MGYSGYYPSYSGFTYYPDINSQDLPIDKEDLTGNVDLSQSKIEEIAKSSGAGSALVKPTSAAKPNAATPFKPTSKDALTREFLDYFQEGVKKGFIGTTMNQVYMDTMNSWTIEANSAQGDCLFESIRDILNGYNASARKPILVAPYYDASNRYSVSSLRHALIDYIQHTPDFALNGAGDGWYQRLEAGFNAASKKQKQSEYGFAMDAKYNFLPLADALANMRLSATPKERRPGERVLPVWQYFWGELISISIFEVLFGIKFVIINQQGITGLGNGQLVEHKGKTGTIVSRDSTHTIYDVEYDDYSIEQVNRSELIERNRYSIYCFNSLANTNKLDLFAFIYWTGGNHFEALYQNLSRGRKYIFNAGEIPSYLKYMIFVSCYQLIPLSSSSGPDDTYYGQIDTLRPYLSNMMDIYNAKLKSGPDALKYSKKKLINGGAGTKKRARTRVSSSAKTKKAASKTAGPPLVPAPVVPAQATPLVPAQATPVVPAQAIPLVPAQATPLVPAQAIPLAPATPVVPAVPPVPAPAKANASTNQPPPNQYSYAYNSNYTFYIAIDLELYPGDHIPLEAKAELACQMRYEKVRKSYAEMFGLLYQPNELVVPMEVLMKQNELSYNKTKKNIPSNSNNNITRRANKYS